MRRGLVVDGVEPLDEEVRQVEQGRKEAHRWGRCILSKG